MGKQENRTIEEELKKWLEDKGVNVGEELEEVRLNKVFYMAAGEDNPVIVDKAILEHVILDKMILNKAIYIAVGEGNQAIVERLVNRGVAVNEFFRDNMTPLQVILHKKGDKPDIEAVNNLNTTLIEIAHLTENIDLLKHINTQGIITKRFDGSEEQLQLQRANIYKNYKKLDKYLVNYYGKTPLAIACSKGHYDIVKYLVEHGAEINKGGTWEDMPLYIACSMGHLDIVKYLVEKGAKINQCEDLQDILLLIARNGNHYCRKTPLYIACSMGHLDIVKYLVEKGAYINQYDPLQKTALAIACSKGHYDIVKYLVEHGAEINKGGMWEDMPLYIAYSMGHIDIVKYLLDHGADINQPDDLGQTLLFIECKRGNYNRVKYLVEHGAEVNKVAFLEKTPLHIACEEGHYHVVQYLLSKVLTVDKIKILLTAGKNKCTMSTKDIKEIAENFVEINKKDRTGRTPLDRALIKNDKGIVKLLLEHGACINRVADRNIKFLEECKNELYASKIEDKVREIPKENISTIKRDVSIEK